MTRFPVITVLIALSLLTGAAIAQQDDHDYELSKTLKFRLKKDGEDSYKLRSDVSVEIVCLSDRSAEWGSFQVLEHPTATVKKLRAFVNGKEVRGNNIWTQPAGLRDIFLSDNLIHHIEFPDYLEVGDVFKYSYRSEFVDYAYMPILTVRNIDYVRTFMLRFEHPKDIHIDFEFFFPHGQIPYRITRLKPSSTTLSFDSVLFQKDLPYHAFDEYRAAILVTATREGVPVMPTTPQTLLEWFAARTNLIPKLLPEHSQLLREQLVTANTNRGRLSIIHDYVRTNVRSIADGRYPNNYIPHDPSTVLDRKYGDCKDRAYLVTALAAENNIPVCMALVSTTPTAEFESINFALYNHVICCYRDSLGTIFFDPTAKYVPFGSIPQVLVGRPALVLDPDGAYVETVRSTHATISMEIDVKAHLDSLESGRVAITLRNDYFQTALRARDNLTEAEMRSKVDSIISSRLCKVLLDGLGCTDEGSDFITFEASADITDFVVSTNRRDYVCRTPFNVADQNLLSRRKDSLGLYFTKPETLLLSFELRTQGHTLDSDSTSLRVGDSLYFKTAAWEIDSGLYQFQYEFKHLPVRIPAGDKAPSLDFYSAYLDAKNDLFILHRREN